MPRPLQTPADLPDAHAIPANPVEDLPDHRGFLLDHLVAGQPPACVFARIAVAVGRVGQDTDGSLSGGMAFAAPAALDDLRPLVLGDNALDLQQQIVFRRQAERAIEEHYFHAGTLELIEQQDLVTEAARQPIGRMDVEALEVARRSRITQPFQGWALQRGTAVAVVDETESGGGRWPSWTTRVSKAAIWLAMVPSSVCCSEDTRA